MNGIWMRNVRNKFVFVKNGRIAYSSPFHMSIRMARKRFKEVETLMDLERRDVKTFVLPEEFL